MGSIQTGIHYLTQIKVEKKGALRDERESIRENFASIVLEILDSFEKRNIKVKRLKIYLSSYGISPSSNEMPATLLTHFQSTTSLEDVFLILSTYYSSWFNIQLLKVIVKKFGSDDDKKLITNYEEKLVLFLRHSIFKIPSRSYTLDHEGAGLVSLYLFLPDGDVPTGQDVADIQHNLSKQLGIPDGILQFIGYKEGCVILIFAVPEVLVRIDIPKCCLKKHIPRFSKHTYRLDVDLTCILPQHLKDSIVFRSTNILAQQLPLERKRLHFESNLISKGKELGGHFKQQVRMWQPTREETIKTIDKIASVLELYQTNMDIFRSPEFASLTELVHYLTKEILTKAQTHVNKDLQHTKMIVDTLNEMEEAALSIKRVYPELDIQKMIEIFIRGEDDDEQIAAIRSSRILMYRRAPGDRKKESFTLYGVVISVFTIMFNVVEFVNNLTDMSLHSPD